MHTEYLLQAIELAKNFALKEGGPFGAIIVHNNQVIGKGYNRVLATNDPTAHAEIEAIREACQVLNRYHLQDCILYTSCEPCPMCLGAIQWSRIHKIYYGATKEDAAAIGFADNDFYKFINANKSDHKQFASMLLRDEALKVFHAWQETHEKVIY